eukprot:SAG11_NODE_8908_length_964_cov_0.921387_1_plen_23_part_01
MAAGAAAAAAAAHPGVLYALVDD